MADFEEPPVSALQVQQEVYGTNTNRHRQDIKEVPKRH